MILISLLPVLLLVGSANCVGAPVCNHDRPGAASGIFGGKQAEHDTATCDDSLPQAARRWSRRVNLPPGADEVVSLFLTARSFFQPPNQTESADVPRPTPDLAQCWQFHWRTAFPPRAPSLVS
jgi:hypothetical protein